MAAQSTRTTSAAPCSAPSRAGAALQVFAYQSWLWNEGVKQYLRDVVGVAAARSRSATRPGRCSSRASSTDAGARCCATATFPLLAPGSTLRRSRAWSGRRCRCSEREDMTLADLARAKDARDPLRPRGAAAPRPPGTAHGGRGAKRDELNQGRLRVNVAFTLPPGAYATLVVKRLFHWTLEPHREPRPDRRRSGAPVAAAPVAPAGPTAVPTVPAAPQPAAPEEPRGFLARRRAEKAARKTRREAARKPR